jgi:hypothetical protein
LEEITETSGLDQEMRIQQPWLRLNLAHDTFLSVKRKEQGARLKILKKRT